MSKPYPKTYNLYIRDQTTGFVVDADGQHLGLSYREFGQIGHWLVTEKLDGTNIRVSLELTDGEFVPWNLRFCGRTDKAQIPKPLLAYLEKTFTLDKMRALWRGKKDCAVCSGMSGGWVAEKEHAPFYDVCECVQPYPITLYGEGYGAGIQRGGKYRPDASFRLFDVVADDRYWLDWENVCGIAEKLGIKTVPLIGESVCTSNIELLVRYGLVSYTAREDQNNPGLMTFAEGIVARTNPYLYTVHGDPVRFKLKTADYAPTERE